MKQFQYTIREPVGIHARPAGMLVHEVKKYKSKILITKNGKSANALSLMALMGLCVHCGDTVMVTVDGEDEAVAAPAVEIYFKEKL
jgi:phosphocarrier protein